MIKSFYLLCVMLLMLLGGVAFHFLTYDDHAIAVQTKALAALTRVTSPAFGLSYREPRIVIVEQQYNAPYPDMPQPSKMGFVYAQ